MNLSKINKEFITVLDNQEAFFKTMLEMEIKHDKKFIEDFLNDSQAINTNYILCKSQRDIDYNPFRDYMNKVLHKSLDRTISKQEYIDQILGAYSEYKKRGSWRMQKAVIKRLIKASNPNTGIKNRSRFDYLK